jgi:CRP/FNR family cyclic AMP-dependent transcriptional regulator
LLCEPDSSLGGEKQTSSKDSLTAMAEGNCKTFYNLTHKVEVLSPLDRVGWLSEEPEEFKSWAAEIGRWRVYRAGQFLFHAGDESDGLYGLASGRLQIAFPFVGEEPVTIHQAEIGFWIGDVAVLANIPRVVSLMAATESRLFHLPTQAVTSLLAKHPKHWISFYKLNALNSRTLLTLLSEVLALTVRARVCRRLLLLSEKDQHLEITQDELAQLLGVTRPTLARCLADLKARGGISIHYRKLRVLDAAVLAAFRDEQ